MAYLILKAALTGLVVVGISEISKRSSLLAAALASLPLTTILAFIWIYIDSKNIESIKELSYGVFWMVLPSLSFFLIFPALLKTGLKFYPSLCVSCLCLSMIYTGYIKLLNTFGVQI